MSSEKPEVQKEVPCSWVVEVRRPVGDQEFNHTERSTRIVYDSEDEAREYFELLRELGTEEQEGKDGEARVELYRRYEHEVFE